MKRSELIFTSLLVPVDFLMLLAAILSVYLLRTSPLMVQYRPVLFYENLPLDRYLFLALIGSVFLVFIFALVGLYGIKTKRKLLEDFVKICIGVSAGVLFLVFYIFIRREWFDSRFLILAGWLAAIIYTFTGRIIVTAIQAYLIKYYHIGTHSVLIVGQDSIGKKISQKIKKDKSLGYRLSASLVEPDLKLIKKRLVNTGFEEIILTDPNWPRKKILELINFCEDKNISFKFVPNLFQALTANTSIETLGGVPLVDLKRTALDGWGKIIKRIVDFIGSLFGLIILSPLFLIIAFFIKWDSKGPVLVKLKRVSQGKEFNLYKFRSMVDGAENLKDSLIHYNERKDGPLFKIKNDPRITRVGKILRKYRLDELAQLINVLKGEMSLIGPRPHELKEIKQYQKHHRKVLAIKAGMTGLAQASGSSDLPFEEEIKLDTYYVEDWSLLMDIKIFFKTLMILLKDRSAC